VRRLSPLLAALATVLAAPVAADAEIYCVGTSGPDCTPQASFVGAIAAANSSSGRDTIRLGPGTYGSNYVVGAGNLVDIEGAGPTTSLVGAAANAISALRIDSPGSTVSNLQLVVPEGASNSGLRTMGPARDLTVSSHPAAINPTGVVLDNDDPGSPAVLERSAVTIANANAAGVTGRGVVRDSTVDAPTGVIAVAGSLRVERSRLFATTGADGSPGALTLDSVLISLDGSFPIGVRQSCSLIAGSTAARHLTIRGNGISDSVGLSVSASAASMIGGCSNAMTVQDTVIDGVATALRRQGDAPGPGESGGTAQLTVAYSLFDFATVQDLGGPGSYVQAQNVPGNPAPAFTDPAGGDFTPLASSPLLDAGDPAASPAGASATDLLGRPRVAGSRRDIGAFERPAGPVVAVSAPVVDDIGPRIGIGPKRVRLTKKGFLKLRLRCPASESGGCRGSASAASAKKLRLRSDARKRRLRLGTKAFARIAGGKSKVVAIKVSHRGRTQIARRGKLSVKVVVRASDAAGNPRTTTRKIAVLPFKAKR
jgi:hypothetical protein